MENLLKFLVKFSSLLLFLLLETVAVVLMVNHNNYHYSVIMSTSNVVSGSVLSVTDQIKQYFGLSHTNRILSEQNARLQNQLLDLQNRLDALQAVDTLRTHQPDTCRRIPPERAYHFIPAKVINNSVNKFQNYMTLNKGSLDGVDPDMGVVCAEGVVGIVVTVSEHFCVVLPVLNPSSRISCRLDGSKTFGSLVWDGYQPEYARLEEIPRHVRFEVGEQIYTSGFSDIFPEGIPVGTVESYALLESDSFYQITVALSTNFRKLMYVDIIAFDTQNELQTLQNDIP